MDQLLKQLFGYGLDLYSIRRYIILRFCAYLIFLRFLSVFTLKTIREIVTHY